MNFRYNKYHRKYQFHQRQRSESCCRELMPNTTTNKNNISLLSTNLSRIAYNNDMDLKQNRSLYCYDLEVNSNYKLNSNRACERDNLFNSFNNTNFFSKLPPKYGCQNSINHLEDDKPLVPRPSFVSRSTLLVSSPSLVHHYNSISSNELYRNVVNVFPNGSPYHHLSCRTNQLNSFCDGTSVTHSNDSYKQNSDSINACRRRRPLSFNFNDETYLNWSAHTIVRIIITTVV